MCIIVYYVEEPEVSDRGFEPTAVDSDRDVYRRRTGTRDRSLHDQRQARREEEGTKPNVHSPFREN